jgi:hypothetical protein
MVIPQKKIIGQSPASSIAMRYKINDLPGKGRAADRKIEPAMGKRIGVLAAILSSTIGGMAGATTRFIIADTDPMTLGVIRYGGGFLVLLSCSRCARPRAC